MSENEKKCLSQESVLAMMTDGQAIEGVIIEKLVLKEVEFTNKGQILVTVAVIVVAVRGRGRKIGYGYGPRLRLRLRLRTALTPTPTLFQSTVSSL